MFAIRDFAQSGAALLAALFISEMARAESWPPIEKLADTAGMIIHCRTAKGPDGTLLFAVVATWKDAYKPEFFVPVPPQGFIIPQDGPPPEGDEFILVFAAHNRTAGKYQRHDLLLPITGGKIRYPGATSTTPGRDYAVAELKTIIQNSVRFPLVNGGFDDSPAGSEPAGWKAAYPNGAGVVTKEGADTFLRLASTTGANAGMAQQVAVPPGAKSVLVMGRMRGKPRNAKEEKRARVEVAVRYLDAKGAMINAAVLASEDSPTWRTFRREATLPNGCVKVEVVARSVFAVGTFDFDSVRVEFK